jgi:short-subunit dehydrogenase
MDLQLAGKVALITGSSRGIGLATAKALAAEGCRLMLSARSAEPLAAAAAALRTSGVDVAAHPADGSALHVMLALYRGSRQVVVTDEEFDSTDVMGELLGKRQRVANQP